MGVRLPTISGLCCLISMSVLVGCSDSHLRANTPKTTLSSAAEDTAAKKPVAYPDQAVVYIYRPLRTGGHLMMAAPVVNDKVIGNLAMETYLKLVLDPGEYAIGTIYFRDTVNSWQPRVGDRSDKFVFEKGKTYYLNYAGLDFFKIYDLVPAAEAEAELSNYKLARYDPRNLSTKEHLLAYLEEQKKAKQAKDILAQRLEAERRQAAQKAIPLQAQSAASENTVGNFIVGLASLFLISLAAFSIGYSQVYSHVPTQPLFFPNEPVITNSQQYRHTNSHKNYITSEGDMVHVNGNHISSPTLGKSWKIDGNKITGTDGSRYRITGNTIFSSTGQTYKIENNTIRGFDGTVCTVSGNLINCW
ncbi:MAG: DUF2846 domain-containing protein [Betaproteobacteria bacterium]|nr:DUF2846 domain-containing protein [Betaproteobacteria bacterium]